MKKHILQARVDIVCAVILCKLLFLFQPKVRELEQVRLELDSLQASHQQTLIERDQHARKGESLQRDMERLTPLEDEITQLRTKVAKMDAMNAELAKLRQQVSVDPFTRPHNNNYMNRSEVHIFSPFHRLTIHVHSH